MKTRVIRITIEIVAALTFIILPLILVPVVSPLITDAPLQPVLKGVVLLHSMLVAFYYWNFYFAIPRFYFSGQTKKYGLITLSILALLVLALFSDPGYNVFPSPPFRYPNFVFFMSIVIRFMMIMFISFALASYSRLRKVQEENLRTELAYLKAQINPHFLFNTLNSIYALTVKKSEAASESVTRLSSIMRYVITDAAGDLVPLEKEIDYLRSYIELEQLRLTDKTSLRYTFPEVEGKMVAPLIFLPLIENVFKYGVSTTEPSFIEIKMELSGNDLILTTRNSRPQQQAVQSSGLGISNVRKRLNILYPGRHTFTINETGKEFSVNLALRLQ
jgi:hypothetical protein